MEYSNRGFITEEAQISAFLYSRTQSPFLQETLKASFSQKTLNSYIASVVGLRQDLIQEFKNLVTIDILDREMAKFLQKESPKIQKAINEQARLVQEEILKSVDLKLQKIIDGYKVHKNQGQALKEVQNYQMYGSSGTQQDAKALVKSKISSFFKNSKDKETVSTQQAMDIQQECSSTFMNKLDQALKFQQAPLKKTPLPKCFYYDNLNQLKAIIDQNFQKAYAVLNSDSKTSVTQSSVQSQFETLKLSSALTPQSTSLQSSQLSTNLTKRQLYQSLSSKLTPIITHTINSILSQQFYSIYANLGSYETRDLVMQSFVLSIFPIKASQLEYFKVMLQPMIQVIFYDQESQMKDKKVKEYEEMIENASSMDIEELVEYRKALGINDSIQALFENAVLITLVWMGSVEITIDNTLYFGVTQNDARNRQTIYSFLTQILGSYNKAAIFISILEQEIAVRQLTLDPENIKWQKEFDLIQSLMKSCKNEAVISHVNGLGQPKVKMQLLTQPDKMVHKHAVIAISGFLSEKSDQTKDWAHLQKFCDDHGYPLLCVSWEAQSVLNLGKIALSGLTTASLSSISTSKGLSDLFSAKNIAGAYNVATQVTGETVSLFKKARENAKKTGKLLGFYLAHGKELESYSVSLIGFSLGSQVIKSCLNTLAKLGMRKNIHNVYFLGGATYIRPEKQELQKSVFQQVVQGRVRNVYTDTDSTLLSFQMIFEQLAIGRTIQYKLDPDNLCYKQNKGNGNHVRRKVIVNEESYRLINYDISSICKGHLSYRINLDKILDFIDFEF